MDRISQRDWIVVYDKAYDKRHNPRSRAKSAALDGDGKGKRPRPVPSVKPVNMVKPVKIPRARWLLALKDVGNRKLRRGVLPFHDVRADIPFHDIRFAGYLLAEDGTVQRVLIEVQGYLCWCPVEISLADILTNTYGIVLDRQDGGSWGSGHKGERDTAYFTEHGDVVFDADPSLYHIQEDLTCGYFKDRGGHPFVSV